MYISPRADSNSVGNNTEDGEGDRFERPRRSRTVSEPTATFTSSQQSSFPLTPTTNIFSPITASNHILSTQPALLEVASTSLNLPAPTKSSVSLVAPDNSGLPRGAIIGISIGSIIFFIFVIFIVDVLLLSNRIRRNFIRSSPDRKDPFAPQRPLILPRSNTITRKPVPPPEVPLYDKEIKHSRALSLDSASRYSRSTGFWSDELDTTTLLNSEEKDWTEKHESYYRYSISVFEDDGWEEWMEEKGRAYNGPVKPGMGVQKRYTASSFGVLSENLYTASSFGPVSINIDDTEKRDITFPKRRFPTWILNDPLERWRRGLHPLAGRRGDGLERISRFK